MKEENKLRKQFFKKFDCDDPERDIDYINGIWSFFASKLKEEYLRGSREAIPPEEQTQWYEKTMQKKLKKEYARGVKDAETKRQEDWKKAMEIK